MKDGADESSTFSGKKVKRAEMAMIAGYAEYCSSTFLYGCRTDSDFGRWKL